MNDFHEVCQTKHGLCIINKHDEFVSSSLKRFGAWCQHELDLLQQLIPSGGSVVEAGANYGAHTIAFARWVGENGRVYAFEPQRIVFQALCGSAALNSIGNLIAYNAAVGEIPGWIDVPQPNYASVGNFGAVTLNPSLPMTPEHVERVPVMTIDQLNLSRCDLIKADVEGMEAAVVNGGMETIKRLRPRLYLENHDDDRRNTLVQLCKSLGYVTYWHGTSNDPNMLCLPVEQRISVQGLARTED